jgi:iron complex transport system ATP-binding protein
VGHLSARALTVAVGSRTLLEGVDFDAVPGEFAAVVGPNGVGKTTLLRVLAGALAPRAGSVFLDGAAVRRMSSLERAGVLTLLVGDAGDVGGMTVREVVTVGRYAHHAWWDWRRDDADATAVDAALKRVEVKELADRPLTTLSSGERARVWLALALAQGVGTLLLDEPTSHLDVRFAQEMLALLRDIAHGGATVVAVLHDLNEAAAFADRVAVLALGRVLAYDAPRIALSPQALEVAYGIRFDVLETQSGYRIFTTAPTGRTAALR